MKSPFTGSEAEITKKWETLTYRKETFQVLFHAYRCPDTGNSFEDEAFAQLNYTQLVNPSLFKMDELEVLQHIADHFEKTTTQEIIDLFRA